MRLDRITADLPTDVPFATVVLDATRESETGEQAVLTRWKDLRRSLEGQGAPEDALEALEERVRVISRAGGQHGRVLVAAGGEILLDCSLAEPPAADEALFAEGPNAFALARVADEHVRYLLVAVDRSGADLTLHDSAQAAAAKNGTTSLEGGHDVLTKAGAGSRAQGGFRTGGRAQRRFETRAEDSWERNAEAVAAELDRIVGQRHPELVVLTGDVRARALVVDAVGPATREALAVVEGGSRADGVKEGVFAARVRDTLQEFRLRRREVVLDRFRQFQGQDGPALTGRMDVLDVLRRGQVAELIVTEAVAGPPSSLAGKNLWVGDTPLEIGLSEQDVADLGVSTPRKMRADLALGRAALAQGAGITVADEASIALADGVGALLRWHDAATPNDRVFSQSADAHRV
ncbi:Vms1/Ankzf1 family peptidyl-tRNA hydrolase [Georgenia sp. SYP-B2076]|uniref:baeRF2 domain-containing protein n=1 Tax=Georgenia sp. SYP-B2076 TaxID=2495881 RepID=UPI0013DF0065|nr:Vms1/Ankzf1 family peptidyl-tRNA hydrolase [Georgenia sp. SYP-B2076]